MYFTKSKINSLLLHKFLREINYSKYWASETAILTFLEGLNILFGQIEFFKSAKSPLKYNTEPLEMSKWLFLRPKIFQIDFT